MATRYIICLFLTLVCLCLVVEVDSAPSTPNTPAAGGKGGGRRLLVREHERLDKAAKRQIVVVFSSRGTSSNAMEKGENSENMVGSSAKVRPVWDSIAFGDAIHTSNAVISSSGNYVPGEV